jgi:ribosomal protein L32
MTPLPKKKHTRARTGKRRGKNALKASDLFSFYSKGKGIENKLGKK